MMRLLTITALVIITKIGTLQGKPSGPTNDATVVSTARIVHHNPVTGVRRNLHKQDIQKLGKGENHNLRIHFDNNEWHPIDINVSQGSVWTKDSAVVVRRGHHKILMPHAVNENCFLRGSLVDGGGVVTINRCGSMTGMIHTPSHHYQIEEDETSGEGDSNLAHTTFKVSKRRHERDAFEDHYDQKGFDMVERATLEELEKEDNSDNATVRTKRQARDVKVELVVYLDPNFTYHLYYETGYNTEDKIRDYVVTKWNQVQGIFDDRRTIGASVRIALKRIDIWWDDPPGYPANEVHILDRLRWFCQNTPETDHFDLKVLYTKDTGDHIMGMAFVGTLCRQDAKCFVAKTPDIIESIRFDIHEFGHSLGFKHDPDIGNCGPVGGFMGWDDTLRYLPCYRKVLRSKLKSRHMSCLFEDNVTEDLHGFTTPGAKPRTTTPYWLTPTPPWANPC